MRAKNSLDCYCCCLQLNHWNKWLPVFTTGEVKSTEEGFADDTLVVATGPLQCLPAKKHATDPELHAELLCKSRATLISPAWSKWINRALDAETL